MDLGWTGLCVCLVAGCDPCLPWVSSSGAEPAGCPACPGHENHLGSFLQMHIPAPCPRDPTPSVVGAGTHVSSSHSQ